MPLKRVATSLTYAGALPFIGVTFCIGAAWRLPFDLDAVTVLTLYSAVICSFLAGIHWQIGLTQSVANNYCLFFSNFVALLAWALLLIDSSWKVIAAFAVLFVALLGFDTTLYKRRLIPGWFFALRIRVSILVVAVLAFTAVSLRQ
ncbi:MAG: DUF3429 domain-containing protein [Gammaproteobacteria bacterium]|nr:DUF3429 domain-containing protein [Gammaproteobacteria bacterium]